jgi:hypothetical protein
MAKTKIFEGIGRLSRKVQGKKAKIKTRPGQKKGSPHYKTDKKGQHKSVSQKTTSKYDKKTGKTRTKQGAAVVTGAAAVTAVSQAGKEKQPAKQPSPKATGFGAAFRKARNDYLNDRSKAKTFEWNGNKYHVRIKGETPAMLETQRSKTIGGAYSKKGGKGTVSKQQGRKIAAKSTTKSRRLTRLKKRQARVAKRKNPLVKGRSANLKKRIDRLEKKAGGGLAKHGYDTANVTGKGGLIDFMERGPAHRISSRGRYAAGRPYKVAGMGVMNPDEPKGVGPGGMKKGGLAQGYDDRLDESLGAKHGKKKQSLKSRRAESKGMEKSMNRKAYASVGTMDKKSRAKKPRGVGAAKRGYGRAMR